MEEKVPVFIEYQNDMPATAETGAVAEVWLPARLVVVRVVAMTGETINRTIWESLPFPENSRALRTARSTAMTLLDVLAEESAHVAGAARHQRAA